MPDAKIKHSIRTGITFPPTAGVIHPYHEIQACIAANYRYFHDWQELTQEQKAVLVAYHIEGILIENHQQDAANEEMERKSRKGSKKK